MEGPLISLCVKDTSIHLLSHHVWMVQLQQRLRHQLRTNMRYKTATKTMSRQTLGWAGPGTGFSITYLLLLHFYFPFLFFFLQCHNLTSLGMKAVSLESAVHCVFHIQPSQISN